ncbi:cytochrome c [Pendulispora brunnea]|uniref:Cytochrome c n=1 Tax=Pendulispora brunnea TaxID=2905690 RepID=A0ABZ2KIB9_9BACT
MPRTLLSFICSVVLAFGCAGSNQGEAQSPPPTAADDGEVQAARGAKLYAARCALCHGASGEGSREGPPVVGKDALPRDPRPNQKYRKSQFNTALDVAQFVSKNMPPKNPGSLSESEYWDIVAFDLKANGVSVAGKHIDVSSAANIKLH